MKGYIYEDWKPTTDDWTTAEYVCDGIRIVDIISYELPYELSQGYTGRVTVAGNPGADYSYHIIRIDGKLYHIKSSDSTDGKKTTLVIGDDASIYDDVLAFCNFPNYNAWSLFNEVFPSQEGVLSRAAAANYGRPHQYKSIVSAEAEAFLRTVPVDLESLRFDGIDDRPTEPKHPINVGKLMRYIRFAGVNVTYSLDSRFVIAECTEVVPNVPVPIFDKDGHSNILTADFNNNATSYVLVQGRDNFINNYEFMNVEGVAVAYNAVPLPVPTRKGHTAYPQDLTVTTLDAARVVAQAEIDKDTFAHKIVFESDKILHLGQPVIVCLERGNYRSLISSVIKKSGTDWLQYTCGDLPITASEMIRDNAWTYDNIPKNPRRGQLVFV